VFPVTRSVVTMQREAVIDAVLELGALRAHVQDCDFMPVTCSNEGCDEDTRSIYVASRRRPVKIVGKRCLIINMAPMTAYYDVKWTK
jgi:hypothetical protein